MEKEILNKPNQTIMIGNSGEISVTQRKVYNIILFEARKELLKNNGQNYFYFSIAELKKKAGVKATDNWHLKKDLEKLSDIKVEIIKDKKEDWGFFRLLSGAEKEGDLLKIDLPSKIKEALINNDYYTPLDLLTMKKFKGKYSVILYEIALRYKKTEIPRLTIEEFKKLTGTENYKNFSDIKRFCIEPGIEEIRKQTDINLNYETASRGRKIISIKLNIIHKKENEKLEDKSKTYSKEVEKLFSILKQEEQLESRKVELEKLLKEHTSEYLAADIKYCNTQKTKNYWAYFLESTKRGHFSKNDIQKEKQKMFEQKRLFQSELDEEAALKVEISKIYDNLSDKELRMYKEKYENQKEIFKKKVSFENFIKGEIVLSLQ